MLQSDFAHLQRPFRGLVAEKPAAARFFRTTAT